MTSLLWLELQQHGASTEREREASARTGERTSLNVRRRKDKKPAEKLNFGGFPRFLLLFLLLLLLLLLLTPSSIHPLLTLFLWLDNSSWSRKEPRKELKEGRKEGRQDRNRSRTGPDRGPPGRSSGTWRPRRRHRQVRRGRDDGWMLGRNALQYPAEASCCTQLLGVVIMGWVLLREQQDPDAAQTLRRQKNGNMCKSYSLLL